MSAGQIDILVSEVGPRDGLQNVKRVMPTAIKHRWIAALAAAGLREIEVGSFVSPKLLPQMADTDEVAREARKIDGLTVLALAPNVKGAERGIAAGVHKLNFPVSASRAHSMANIRMTPEEAVEQVRQACQLRNAPPVEVGISTAFGCTIEGEVSEDWVMQLAAKLAAAGATSVGLSDSTGMANPAQVSRVLEHLAPRFPNTEWTLHTHDTRAMAIPNILAAMEMGVSHLDASIGGLGGCPFAPGASGNVCTEDLVHCLDAMGIETGIDLDALIETSKRVQEIVGRVLPGQIVKAGKWTRRYPLPDGVRERIPARA